MNATLTSVATSLEAALTVDETLAAQAVAAINAQSPAVPATPDTLDSVDQVLALIHEFRPGWSLVIHGTASQPNGHWRCTLRRSSRRDEDEYLGVGRGPTLPHALLAALLKVLAFEQT